MKGEVLLDAKAETVKDGKIFLISLWSCSVEYRVVCYRLNGINSVGELVEEKVFENEEDALKYFEERR